MVGDRAWAEDLAQEAFIQAHQNLGRLGPPYDFKSWVYRIAGNLALDGLRRYRDTVPLPDWDGGEAPAPEPADQRREGDPEDQAQLADVRDAVWRAIHQLPDNYRQVLILREIDALSYNEIATVLGVSLDNVRVLLHRARLRFRDLYGIQVMVEEGRLACQGLDELLSAYVDGELDRATRKQVKAHIDACPACQKKRRNLLAVSGMLAALVPVFPPPSLHARFLTRLEHLPPPESPPPPATPAGGQPSGSGGGLFGGGPAPWLLALGGGAIILIAGAAILGLLTLPYLGAFAAPTDTPAPPSPSSTPAAMPTRTPAATPIPTSPTTSPISAPTSTPIPRTPTPVPPTSTSPPPPPPPPPPTSTPPPPTPEPYIALWVDANVVPAGNCTRVRWQTEHVQAVFFDGQGVSGTGSHQTCPCADEPHTLDVLLPDGSHDIRTVIVRVSGSCVTPTPDTQGPPAPVPDSPTGNAAFTCRSTVTLSWNPASDPAGVSGYIVRLQRLQVDDSWGLEGEWGPMNGLEQDVPVSCGGIYRWSVRARDGMGNPGPWSEWARFGIGID
jgi:RNA polymerase sigma factor (sigma-70 family)